MPQEVRDYILIRDLYHCLPSALDEESAATLDLHFALLTEDKKAESSPKSEDRLNRLKAKLKN